MINDNSIIGIEKDADISPKSIEQIKNILQIPVGDLNNRNRSLLIKFNNQIIRFCRTKNGIYILSFSNHIFIESNTKTLIDSSLRNIMNDEGIDIPIIFADVKDIFSPQIEDEPKVDYLTNEINNLRRIEAKILSSPWVDSSQIGECLYGSTNAKVINELENRKSEILSTQERKDLMDKILRRIVKETEFLNPHEELGIVKVLLEGLPDSGTIDTGGRFNARYSWGNNRIGGLAAAGFFLDTNPKSNKPNIGIDLPKPSFTRIITALALEGGLSYAVDAFTEEVCHAFQHREGTLTFEKIPIEGQAKRLHSRREGYGQAQESLKDPRSANSSSRLVSYTKQYGARNELLEDIKIYGYKRIFRNLSDFIDDTKDDLKSKELICILNNVLRLPFDLTIGEKLEKDTETKAEYILRNFDILRAMNASEQVIADLAAMPGNWEDGHYKRIEATVENWKRANGYDDLTVEKLLKIYFLKRRIAQLKAMQIAQEEITNLDYFKSHGVQYSYFHTLEFGTTIAFDV